MTPPAIIALCVATATLYRVARKLTRRTCPDPLDKQLEAARDDGILTGYLMGVQDRLRSET